MMQAKNCKALIHTLWFAENTSTSADRTATGIARSAKKANGPSATETAIVIVVRRARLDADTTTTTITSRRGTNTRNAPSATKTTTKTQSTDRVLTRHHC